MKQNDKRYGYIAQTTKGEERSENLFTTPELALRIGRVAGRNVQIFDELGNSPWPSAKPTLRRQ